MHRNMFKNLLLQNHLFFIVLAISEMMEKGTELKLLVTYPDEGKAVFKPMRYVDPFLLLVYTWQSPIINLC